MPAPRLLALLVSALFLGCVQGPEAAAAEEARGDLNCDDVVVIDVQFQPSRIEQGGGVRRESGCPSASVTVHGCGRSTSYVCTPDRDCDYACDGIRRPN